MVLPLTRRTVLFVSCLGARGKRRILAVSLVSQKAMGIKGMSKRGIAISVLNSEETTLPTTPVFAAGGQKEGKQQAGWKQQRPNGNGKRDFAASLEKQEKEIHALKKLLKKKHKKRKRAYQYASDSSSDEESK